MSDSAENPQATPGRKRARTQVSQEASLFASPDALEWAAYGTPPRIRQYGEPESGTVPSTSEIQRQVCEVASIQEGTDEGAAAASAEPIEDEVEEEVPRPQRRRRTNAALTWEIAFCLLKLYTSDKIEQYHDKKKQLYDVEESGTTGSEHVMPTAIPRMAEHFTKPGLDTEEQDAKSLCCHHIGNTGDHAAV